MYLQAHKTIKGAYLLFQRENNRAWLSAYLCPSTFLWTGQCKNSEALEKSVTRH